MLQVNQRATGLAGFLAMLIIRVEIEGAGLFLQHAVVVLIVR